MNYSGTLEYMYEKLPMYHRIGPPALKPDLKNILALLRFLDNPHLKFKAIHVAGTNGKGSVCHLLASVLQEAGYKTGLCTSPHLLDFRERIKINGQMVTEAFVVDFIERTRTEIERTQPSFFEISIAMAFDYFAQDKVDIAVIETGLGGRLDSTNVIDPLLSVITSISFDHTALLGNTLSDIAREKAGIIKPGKAVILGELPEEAAAVIVKIAQSKNSPVIYSNEKYHCRFNCFSEIQSCYNINGPSGPYLKGLLCDLSGTYQEKNIPIALCCFDELNRIGFEINEQAIRNGISKVRQNTGLRGRWDIISKKPLVVLDIAHNPDAMTHVLLQIENYHFRKLHFVIGMSEDKDHEAVLKLLPQTALYYFCKPDVPRGLEASKLRDKAMKFGLKGQHFSSVAEALENALNESHEDDMILISGSAFNVADAMNHFKKKQWPGIN